MGFEKKMLVEFVPLKITLGGSYRCCYIAWVVSRTEKRPITAESISKKANHNPILFATAPPGISAIQITSI